MYTFSSTADYGIPKSVKCAQLLSRRGLLQLCLERFGMGVEEEWQRSTGAKWDLDVGGFSFRTQLKAF